MTALGVYLLVSLLFVIGTMIEFAVVLFLERKLEVNQRVNMEPKRVIKVPRLFPFKRKVAKIDLVALVLFLSLYVLFNVAYWSHYLTFN